MPDEPERAKLEKKVERDRQIALELAKKLANLDLNGENEAFIKNVIDLMHVTGATPWQQDQLEVALRVIFNIKKETVPPVW